jgi:Gpi18-like mannosyltransferase
MVFLLRRHFTPAGVVYGLALLLKPQAILLGPVLVFVLVAMRFGPGGSWRGVGRMLGMGAVALLVAFLVSLPHSLAGARIPRSELSNVDVKWHSALWFKRAYVDTVAGDLYPRVSLNAFNVWWLDWLYWGRDPQGARTRVLGISKDTLGKLLLIVGILATWGLCARKWAWAPESWVVCAFLITFCAFMLPTRVHERYIYLCIPFLIALAVHRRVWIAPLLPLLFVGTFEMTSFRWAGNPDTRAFSVLLALMAIAAFLYSFAVLLPKSRPRTATSTSKQAGIER